VFSPSYRFAIRHQPIIPHCAVLLAVVAEVHQAKGTGKRTDIAHAQVEIISDSVLKYK
jgi:hypothetical protein